MELKQQMARKKQAGQFPMSDQVVNQVHDLIKYTRKQFTPEDLIAMEKGKNSSLKSEVR